MAGEFTKGSDFLVSVAIVSTMLAHLPPPNLHVAGLANCLLCVWHQTSVNIKGRLLLTLGWKLSAVAGFLSM